jgi:thymidylate kinase
MRSGRMWDSARPAVAATVGKRSVFSVAIIGPDGAGKSTICRSLEADFPLPIKSIYMGVNLETSRLMLPTTRLLLALKSRRGRQPHTTVPLAGSIEESSKTVLRRASKSLKSILRVSNWVAEEWFRQVVAWSYKSKGFIVLFDRHFFCDFYAHDIAARYGRRPLVHRLHGMLLKRFYPRPDLVILLDAPPDELIARKQGAPREFLESRRDDYLQLTEVLPHFLVVNASLPQSKVVEQVAEAILSFNAAVNKEDDEYPLS